MSIRLLLKHHSFKYFVKPFLIPNIKGILNPSNAKATLIKSTRIQRFLKTI